MYKLLIVEDEKWEREGLVDFLDWSGLGIQIVGSAANGVQGLKLAREFLPEIILTDIRMPLMDGLEFSAEVKRFLPGCRIIIITGYDDFEYAREAIQLGVFEYLLKPIQKQPLLEVLEKTVNVLSEEFEQLEYVSFLRKQISESRHEDRERLLLDLLEGNPDVRRALELERDWNPGSDGKGMVAAVVQYAVPFEKQILPRELVSRIRNGIGEGIAACKNTGGNEVILCLPVGEEDGNQVRDILSRIGRELREAGIPEAVFGVGSFAGAARDFPESYQQAKTALDRIFFRKDMGILFYEDTLCEEETETFDLYSSAAAYSKRILNGIATLDSHTVAALSEELFAFLEGRTLDKAAVCYFFAGLAGEVSALLTGANGSLPPGTVNDDTLGILQGFIKLEHMKKWILELLLQANSRFIEKRNHKEEHIAEKMMDMIRNEYTGSIGIGTIAGRLELSPNYLGGLFRKHMGKRFTEALTEYRMKKAEELLASGTGNIMDTAKAVGFVNAAHFCTVFKKTHGISPAEYQKNVLGQNA